MKKIRKKYLSKVYIFQEKYEKLQGNDQKLRYSTFTVWQDNAIVNKCIKLLYIHSGLSAIPKTYQRHLN